MSVFALPNVINFKPNANLLRQIICYACKLVKVILQIICANCFGIRLAIVRCATTHHSFNSSR